ncbi:MAG: sodium/proton-translocating pyrophosphatase, partial [Myxococcales bacterium]|nr:sodium/proton-translocating pyrophosphatase [Myxococcales bacterium]
MQDLLYLAPAAGGIALLYAFLTTQWISGRDSGTERMQGIAAQIFRGAMAFLYAEYKILGIFVVLVAGLLAVLYN